MATPATENRLAADAYAAMDSGDMLATLGGGIDVPNAGGENVFVAAPDMSGVTFSSEASLSVPAVGRAIRAASVSELPTAS